MIFMGFTSFSLSINFLSQPARGGSRMTVWSGSILFNMFSDLSKIEKTFFKFFALFNSS